LLASVPDGPAVSSRADGTYPFVQFFATRLAEIRAFARKLLKHAAPNALVWISYPKKTSKTGSDLSRDVIREAMSGTGWRAVSIVAIEEVWSALRFRPAAQVGSRPKRTSGLRPERKTSILESSGPRGPICADRQFGTGLCNNGLARLLDHANQALSH